MIHNHNSTFTLYTQPRLMLTLTSLCTFPTLTHRRVSGAEQEHLLSKAKVKHNRMWSPNECVTGMC